MRKRAPQKKLLRMEILMLLLLIFLIVSCNRQYFNGNIAVERHLWQLKKIDTFFREKYRPSATWYDVYNGLKYEDNYHEFPYPYPIGTRIYNFDRK